MASLSNEPVSRIDAIARWRSAVVGIVGMLSVVGVALLAPPDARGEAYTAILGIVSAIVMRHAGQDRDKASP